jgi:hypothetical protein
MVPGEVTVQQLYCTPQPQRGGWQLAGQVTVWKEEVLPRRGLAANYKLNLYTAGQGCQNLYNYFVSEEDEKSQVFLFR